MKPGVFLWGRLVWLLGAMALLIIWSCNSTEPRKSTVLSLNLPDSLSQDMGQYDSIRIDVADTAGNLVRSGVFVGIFRVADYPVGLNDLEIGENIPDIIVVVVTAYRKDGKTLKVTITFTNGVQSAIVFDRAGLDLALPASPIFVGTSGAFTTLDRPLWQWNGQPSGGGNGTFRVRLDSGTYSEQTSTSFQPASPVSEGAHSLSVQERDSAGNWSIPATFVWKVDLTAPTVEIAAPISEGRLLTSSSNLRISGTAADGIGLRSVDYVLSGTTRDSGSVSGSASWFFDLTADEGTTQIVVTATDSAGRTATASISVASDQTKPLLILDPLAADEKITSQNIPVAGTASDSGGLRTVSYSFNNGAPQTLNLSGGRFTFTPACADGDCSVKILAIDSAGNRDSQVVVIHKRANVIFVRKGKTGNGTSWANAYGELSDVLNGSRDLQSGTRIWVGAGRYQPRKDSLNVAFLGDTGVFLMGGFKSDGTQFNESQRAPLFDVAELYNDTDYVLNSRSVDSLTIDGFSISNSNGGGIVSPNSNSFRISHCRFSYNRGGVPLRIWGAYGADFWVYVDSSFFQSNIVPSGGTINLGSARLILSNTVIENNIVEQEGYAGGVEIDIGAVHARGCMFRNNRFVAADGSYIDYEIGVGFNSALDIDDCQITGGINGIRGIGLIVYGPGNTTL